MSITSAESPTPRRTTRVLGALRRPSIAALVAGAVALILIAVAPRGEDAAAHLYQTQIWREHGWRFWDNNWYAGRYSQINYSLLYYPLAAVLGTWTVVVSSVAASAAAFSRLVRDRWPNEATWPSISFTLLAPLPVLTGTYPFILGLALALATLAALQARAWRTAVALGACVALAHLLALLLLDTTLLALAIFRRMWRDRGAIRGVALGFGVTLGITMLSWRAFSTSGATYPFSAPDLAAVVAFCLVALVLARGRAHLGDMRAIFALYALITLVAFVVASPLGSNIGRLVAYLGAPLILIPIAARGFRPRALSALIILATLTWQVYPVASAVRTANGVRSSSEEYWYPVEAFLAAHSDPNHRVEVVATDQHWEAFYLARAGVPLTRGWYRQDDFPSNAELYGDLTRRGYVRWLHRLAVRYVFLPNDRLDYSAEREAELLRSGTLPEVARMGDWTVYEVPRPTPMATPAASITVTAIDATTVTVDALRARRYTLRLHYTPYWKVVRGSACVAPTPAGDTELRVLAPGQVKLRFSVGLGTIVDEVIGIPASCADAVFIGPIAPESIIATPDQPAG